MDLTAIINKNYNLIYKYCETTSELVLPLLKLLKGSKINFKYFKHV